MTGTHCEVDGDRVKDVKAVHLSQELGELHSSHRVAWEEQPRLIIDINSLLLDWILLYVVTIHQNLLTDRIEWRGPSGKPKDAGHDHHDHPRATRHGGQTHLHGGWRRVPILPRLEPDVLDLKPNMTASDKSLILNFDASLEAQAIWLLPIKVKF